MNRNLQVCWQKAAHGWAALCQAGLLAHGWTAVCQTGLLADCCTWLGHPLSGRSAGRLLHAAGPPFVRHVCWQTAARSWAALCQAGLLHAAGCPLSGRYAACGWAALCQAGLLADCCTRLGHPLSGGSAGRLLHTARPPFVRQVCWQTAAHG